MKFDPRNTVLAVDFDHTLWTYPEDIGCQTVADYFNRLTRSAYRVSHERGVLHYVSTGNHLDNLKDRLSFIGLELFSGIFCKLGTQLFRWEGAEFKEDQGWRTLMLSFNYLEILELQKDFFASNKVHFEPHPNEANGPGKASGFVALTPEQWNKRSSLQQLLQRELNRHGHESRILTSLIADQSQLEHFNSPSYTKLDLCAQRTLNWDCLSPHAGKGGPLQDICRWHPGSSIVVAGDSGNDADSFRSNYPKERILPRWNAKPCLLEVVEELKLHENKQVFVSSFPAGMAIVDWLLVRGIVSQEDLNKA